MIAQYPPMGWNSWDCYGAAVTEADVRRNAEYMAKYLKPFGWEYVVVDIQWYQPTASSHEYEPFSALTMDRWGRLTPAENRFPSAATNAALLEIERATHCAHPLYTTDEECVWIAPRTDGRGLYIAAFNLSDAPREIHVEGQTYTHAIELWTGREAKDGLTAALAPHDAAVWRIDYRNGEV